MTCIAWDGKTLAADKRATIGNLAVTCTKILRVRDCLYAFSGDGSVGRELLSWADGGLLPAGFPASAKEGDAEMLQISPKGVFLFNKNHFPLRIEEPIMAIGMGRDFALAAMYCGKTAREAVEIACWFDTSCGNGIDVLSFEP